jgi:hypothetical protein
MLDFYNELSDAIRGRLAGADTLARVNDALKDIFQAFVLDPPGEHPLGEGTFVIPVLRPSGEEIEELARCVAIAGDLGRCVTQVEPITPPLRTLHVHPEQKDPIPSRSGR